MLKKIIIGVSLCVYILGNVFCVDTSITKDMANELQLNEIVNELKKYTDDLDLESITSGLISGNGIEYKEISKSLSGIFTDSISSNIKNVMFLLIFLVLTAIIKSLELDSDSSVTKSANLVATLVIISIFINIYSDVITLMKNAVNIESGIVQIVSPFIMGILILTGAITTSSLLEPIILLLVSTIGFCVNYVIIPLITISIVFNIITNMSEAVNLGKFSKFSNKLALWLNGVLLAMFLTVTGIQTTVSTSVDSVAIKTTQAALSGTIPVAR